MPVGIPPYLEEKGGGPGPNSIDLVFPRKGKNGLPQMEISRGRNPPSPTSISEGVGIGWERGPKPADIPMRVSGAQQGLRNGV